MTMEENARLLIVDDSSTNLILLRNIFEGEGFNVSIAESGKTAFKLLEKIVVDAILLDIMMPVMDGFEVLDKLKTDKKTKDIPVIMVTARQDEEDVQKSINYGASDYIKKPFIVTELVEKVKRNISPQSITSLTSAKYELLVRNDIESPAKILAANLRDILNGYRKDNLSDAQIENLKGIQNNVSNLLEMIKETYNIHN